MIFDDRVMPDVEAVPTVDLGNQASH